MFNEKYLDYCKKFVLGTKVAVGFFVAYLALWLTSLVSPALPWLVAIASWGTVLSGFALATALIYLYVTGPANRQDHLIEALRLSKVEADVKVGNLTLGLYLDALDEEDRYILENIPEDTREELLDEYQGEQAAEEVK